MSKFSERLRELRKESKLTQQELANRLNVSRSSVEMYEKGEREPSFETQEAIADLFNVNLDYLFDRPTEVTLSIDEKELLDLYRLTDSNVKPHIFSYLKYMAEHGLK